MVENPVFAFFMGNIDTDSPTGFLTLGGVNETHYEGEEVNAFFCLCLKIMVQYPLLSIAMSYLHEPCR